MKQTIARQLGIKQFPFEIRNKQGNLIYRELKDGYWERQEFDSEGTQIYYENSKGLVMDNRPKPLQVSDNDYKRLIKALYPKDRSKNFSK
jgi:hypothetical protein